MQTYLEPLKDQLRTVTADLDAMPRCKAGSQWHLDRISEVE
jgi:hypothetical protein